MLSPFFIVGPTATGKSEIAIQVAERCGAEIVSADAFQVYAGLDLLTAKPSADDRRRVPHHLVGYVPLGEAFNVARYHEDAERCLRDLAGRGRRVIVVGGSGLYVKALTHGLSPLPPAQPALRAELENTDLTELLARLRHLDPATATNIDANNKRRLVRALEVCMATGRPFSEQRITWANQGNAGLKGILLVRDPPELLARIGRRADRFLEEDGLEEVRRTAGVPLSETSSRVLGLAEVRALLAGGIDRATCREKIQLATRRYAKRQMTWFRRETVFEKIKASAYASDRACAEAIADKMLNGFETARPSSDI